MNTLASGLGRDRLADTSPFLGTLADLYIENSNCLLIIQVSQIDDDGGEPFECRVRGTLLKDNLKWNESASVGKLVLGSAGRTFNQTISTLQVLPIDVKGFGRIKSCVEYEEMDKAMLSVAVMVNTIEMKFLISESYGLKSREVDVTFLCPNQTKGEVARKRSAMIAVVTDIVVAIEPVV
ncbi:hypothetical protein BDN72DRAFT_865932 [Pluteus cervinus]|uniref:Uncharacterized protein n=1 Tax=Pluteus cervinus TaxID=181527 RepID=A0ACD2ZYA4_9AGAR|nr:hypothetical protein BDN72DRAFT_865932 [Pluteus cervinus]